MSIILFIIALWVWFVLVMQDGRRGSMRIALILPIILPLGIACVLIEHIAHNLRILLEALSAFIMSIGKEDWS